MVERESIAGPFADTSMAKFLDQRIEELKGVKTQKEIAEDLGFRSPNMISMLKTGNAKVPLDKIALLAKSLGVDPGHLLKLGLEQYSPSLGIMIEEILGCIATANEEEILLKTWRRVTNNKDPAPTPRIKEAVDRMIVEVADAVARRE